MVNLMDRQLPIRKSIRLKKYDYSQPGFYFITICTQNMDHLFGRIIVGATPRGCPEMVLNHAGEMIKTVWNEIPQFYNGIQTDEYVIMPNHFHGIVCIVGAGPCACPIYSMSPCACQQNGQPQGVISDGQPRGVAPTGLSLPDVVHRFKTMTTRRYIDGVKQNILPPFNRRIWQRNYWEHIVRNDNELERIRKYILQNPQKWETDKLNGGSGNMVMESSATYGDESWMV